MTTQKTIAFQGTIGANSNLACEKFYPNLNNKAYSSFTDIFAAVESGEIDYGMIPLENSYAGRVSEIHNLLQNSRVSIIAEHFLPIEHHLAAVKNTKLEEIKEVYSHPQALMQCQKSLEKLKLNAINHSNTAEAAQFVSKAQDKTKAALCSELAAKINNLDIIKNNLEDAQDDNITLFVVIARNPIDPDPNDGKIVTTLIFTIRNIPGSLYKSLGGFATNSVNMLKLESYIQSGASREAKFFISIEGYPAQTNVSLALEELGFFSKNVKLLGVYPADPMRYKN